MSLAANADSTMGYAVGRILTVEDGKEHSHHPWIFPVYPFDVYLRSTATGQVDRRELEGNGDFAWKLPPGHYQIAGFQAYGPRRIGRIWTSFVVPEPRHIAYVGTLRLEIVQGSGYRFKIDDDFDETMAALKDKIPTASVQPPLKSLMILEPTLGRASSWWSICSERSGLTCDHSYQGLQALKPAGADKGFPLVDSLEPILQWKPPSVGDFTYDVAVYESISVAPARTLRGKLVAYAEGLSDPTWKISPSLDPGRRYEWSVRLRSGDEVSTWSTSGHLTFLVIGFGGGYGQWFGLSTPRH